MYIMDSEVTELCKLCEKYGYFKGGYNSGGDKAIAGFTVYYSKIFDKIKNNKINMLEIGIFQGRSIAMWCDYFKNGNIYGVDINLNEYHSFKNELSTKYCAFQDNNVKNVYEFDTANVSDNKIKELPMFDIILDDGSHDNNSQYKTFVKLWKKLNKSGIYIIEDSSQDTIERKEGSENLLNIITKNNKDILKSDIFKAKKRENKGDKFLIAIFKS